jgi:hypothetical protein
MPKMNQNHETLYDSGYDPVGINVRTIITPLSRHAGAPARLTISDRNVVDNTSRQG